MRPPQVLREGTKKTVFVNFMDLCKSYVDIFFIWHYTHTHLELSLEANKLYYKLVYLLNLTIHVQMYERLQDNNCDLRCF